jgi:hypothetical protein
MAEAVGIERNKMSGLFEVCFEAGVELLGVIRGMNIETSEGTFPVVAAQRGDAVYVIAGPLVLADCCEGNKCEPPWIYLGHCDVGLQSDGVRRFGSVGAMRAWVAEVRSTAFHPAVTKVVVL